MEKRLSRGAPAKYAHHGIVEKVKPKKRRVTCSDCVHYMEADKSCRKQPVFVPNAGYDLWKYCPDFTLMDEIDTQEMRAYVARVQESIQNSAKSMRVRVKQRGVLILENVLTAERIVYEIDPRREGANILHPSHGLVIKARQSSVQGKTFFWEGRNYKVLEFERD